MAKTAILNVKILGDAKDATKALDKAGGDVDGFGKKLEGLALPSAAAVGAVALFAKSAFDAASRTEQAMGALDAVFGESAAQVKAYAEQAATSMGLSEAAYGEAASAMGAQLQSLGFSHDEAATSANDLITVAADLAATFGGTTADATVALGAAMRGEFDSVESLGIALSAARIEAELAARGQDKLEGKAYDTAKAQATLDLITQQAGGALGQFGRESDGAAGSLQIANAEFENAKAALGVQLLPVVTEAAKQFSNLATWIGANTEATTAIVGTIGGLSAAVFGISTAVKVYNTATELMAINTARAAAGQWALNAAWLANPITWVVVAVIALVVAIVLLWQKNEAFRNFVIGAWEAIQLAAVTAWNWIRDTALAVWDTITGAVTGFIDAAVEKITGWVNFWLAVLEIMARPFIIMFNFYVQVARIAFNVIKEIVEVFIVIWKFAWQIAMAVFKSIWSALVTIARPVFNAIGDLARSFFAIFRGYWDALTTVISVFWNFLKTGARLAFEALSSAAEWAFDLIKGPLDFIIGLFDKFLGMVERVTNALKKIKIPDVSGWLGGVLGTDKKATVSFGTVATVGAAPTLSSRATNRATATAAPTIVVNVPEASDPVATARYLRSLIRRGEASGVIFGAL